MSHLAQVNLAWMRYPLEDPRMAGMTDEIDRINALGDAAPGFVWRFQTPAGDATATRVLGDPTILFNLTIWRTLDDLRRYVYHTEHASFLRRRREWFVRPPKPPVALWWAPEGARPTVEDALAHLQCLWRDGSTPEAFTLAEPYSAEGLAIDPASTASTPANQ